MHGNVELLWHLEREIFHAPNLSSALHVCLVEICKSTEWMLGEIWIPDATDGFLRLNEQWSEKKQLLHEFHAVSKRAFFGPGIGLPGRVWATGRTEWIRDIVREPTRLFHRSEAAQRAGLKAALAIPIRTEGETIAIFGFFMSEERKVDAGYLRLLEIISSQLGSAFAQKKRQEAVRLSREHLEIEVKQRSRRLAKLNLQLREALDAQHQIAAALQESEEWHRLILESSLDAMIITDHQGHVYQWNTKAEEIFGWSEEEARGRLLANLILPSDDRSTQVDGLRRFLRPERGSLFNTLHEIEAVSRNGTRIPVELSIFPIKRRGASYFTAFLRDLSGRKMAEQQIKLNDERLNLVVDATSEGIWDWNIRTGEVYYSPSWIKSLGYSPDEVPARVDFWGGIVHPEDMARVREVLQQHLDGFTEYYECENRLRMKSGRYRWNLDRGKVVEWDRRGRPLRMVGTDTDISDRKMIELARQKLSEDLVRVNARLEQLARTDPLTGLLNRRGLQEILSREMGWVRRDGTGLIVVMIDLDDFKRVNDTLGHSVGDVVVKDVAEKIKRNLRRTDYASRIAGDEFLILLPRTRKIEGRRVAENIRLAVSGKVVAITAKEVRVTASVGMSLVPAGTSSVDELLGLTHAALQSSKRMGKNRVSVAGEHDTDDGRPFRGVRDALRQGDRFRTVLQPILRLADQQTVGYELFSRLQSQVAWEPDEFFRVSIENNILTFVDHKCLQSCLQRSSQLAESARIHVNVFPSTLIDIPVAHLLKDFPPEVAKTQFCMELSEQQIIGDPSYLLKPVRELRSEGIQIAIDDVGFGRSCLESLILLEPQITKIDKSCIHGLRQSEFKRRSLTRLVKTAQSLGSEVIAEGIESEDDLEILRELRVSFGQGFLWGRPD